MAPNAVGPGSPLGDDRARERSCLAAEQPNGRTERPDQNSPSARSGQVARRRMREAAALPVRQRFGAESLALFYAHAEGVAQ